MHNRIAILSLGVWKHRGLVELLSGFEPVLWLPPLTWPRFDCVAGWGHKPTSHRARKLAKKHGCPYIAMEDGFIRSVLPGAGEVPVSLILDRSGIYYDARYPSDLEDLIARSTKENTPEITNRARDGMRLLRERRISKYNHAPSLAPAELGIGGSSGKNRILVIDQTYDDASVTCGLATGKSFEMMLEAALNENPYAEIIVKMHPEVVRGHKKGYLPTRRNQRLHIVDQDVNPWSLIEAVEKVYVVTSQLGFEALLAGREVICFGTPFYSGWGLTDDRASPVRRRRARPSPEQLFAAVYFNYARYVCPDTKREISFEEAVALLVSRRRVFLS